MIENLTDNTINFSADNLRKLFERFIQKILTCERIEKNIDNFNQDEAAKEIRKISTDMLIEVTEDAKIVLGNRTVLDIRNIGQRSGCDKDELKRFCKIA